MNKRVLIVITCICIILTLVIISIIVYNFQPINYEPNYQTSPYIISDEITLNIKSKTKREMEVMIDNNTDKNYMFNDLFIIEEKRDDIWYAFDIENNEYIEEYNQTYELNVGSKATFIVKWKKLKPGNYRLIKKFCLENNLNECIYGKIEFTN